MLIFHRASVKEQYVSLSQRFAGITPFSKSMMKSHSGAHWSSVFIVHIIQPAPWDSEHFMFVLRTDESVLYYDTNYETLFE